jgi:hypothetical protein
VAAEVERLAEIDYREYAQQSPVRTEAIGRKGPGGRAVLVELFAGAEDPLSVAPVLAFDALDRAYKPTEVVRLQYHVHIPGPDPLTSPAAAARQKYYGVNGTPTVLVDGKVANVSGGDAAGAARRFGQLASAIAAPLELPAGAKVQVSAMRSGEVVSVRARVSDFGRPNERLRLRLVLAEDVVRYRGGNGVRYHHAVARGFAGPDQGYALRLATVEQSADVNLADLRKTLNQALDVYQRERPGLVIEDRPLVLNRLRVVAFVQDDATREVLQAAQAEVR